MITGERPSNIACSAEKWQNHEELASRLVLEKELHALSQNIKSSQLQEFLLLKLFEIVINHIQNKSFCLHNICVMCIFIACKYTHMDVYI